MNKTIFITGATGNVGARLVSEILTGDASARLVLLIRSDSDLRAQERLEQALKTADPTVPQEVIRSRTEVLRGDITRNNFGLTRQQYDRLEKQITHIIHAAASTKFNVSLKSARLANVVGTLNVMSLAFRAKRHGSLEGVAYISTAFVCGEQQGRILESELDGFRTFSSPYDRTKWEAENIVRRFLPQLPVTIFRPSIVSGDSRTGRLVTFNVLYTPLKYIGLGALQIVPGASNVRLDVVPVDYVARAIVQIFLKSNSSAGRTFHIVAGKDRSLSTSQITARAVSHFVSCSLLSAGTKVRFLPAMLLRSIRPLLSHRTKRMLDKVKEFEPHIRLKREFDDTNTRAALAGTGVNVPALGEYLDTILSFWIENALRHRSKRAA